MSPPTEDDDEDGPLSVPPAGDPAGDAPLVHDEDAIDDLSRGGAEPSSPPDLDEVPPSLPPAWDEEPLVSSDEEHASEVLSLLVPEDDDAPLAPGGDEDEDDLDPPLATRPGELLDEPFDPRDDDDRISSV